MALAFVIEPIGRCVLPELIFDDIIHILPHRAGAQTDRDQQIVSIAMTLDSPRHATAGCPGARIHGGCG